MSNSERATALYAYAASLRHRGPGAQRIGNMEGAPESIARYDARCAKFYYERATKIEAAISEADRLISIPDQDTAP